MAGLNGAGKTTYARRLATSLPALRLTLDEWMLGLPGRSRATLPLAARRYCTT